MTRHNNPVVCCGVEDYWGCFCLSWVCDEKGLPGSSILEMTAGKPVLSSKPPRGGLKLRRVFITRNQSLLKYEKHSFKCGEKHSFKCVVETLLSVGGKKQLAVLLRLARRSAFSPR